MKTADRQIIARLGEIFDAQSAGGGTKWGDITGTLGNQGDLQSALDAKGPVPSDEAYDATAWNGVTGIAPSKNAVRDKIEAVVASIPTAPSGGVIGTAILQISSDSVSDVSYSDGVLVGATFTYSDASGRLGVVFAVPQSDGNYQPAITVEGSQTLVTQLRSLFLSTDEFQFNIKKVNTDPAIGGSDVDKARITISRLSQ